MAGKANPCGKMKGAHMNNDRAIIAEWKEGNLAYVTFTERDGLPDLSYLTQEYSECTASERAEYKQQDKERLARYNIGEWYMVVVGCEVRCRPANWTESVLVGKSYLSGVESDSTDCIEAAADEVTDQARENVKELKAALTINDL